MVITLENEKGRKRERDSGVESRCAHVDASARRVDSIATSLGTQLYSRPGSAGRNTTVCQWKRRVTNVT